MKPAYAAALLILPALLLPGVVLAATPDVSLSVEPLSSAPPLYQGEPLLVEGGVARIVAVVSGTNAKPGALDYEWSVDSVAIANGSGVGKSSLVVDAPLPYRASTVTVTVSDGSGTLLGTASVDLSTSDPSVRVYVHDPLLGILFDHALSGSYAITGSEVSLYGGAYSFPVDSVLPTFEWFLNGASAGQGAAITLRPTGSGQGAANLSFVASEGELKTTASLSLSFGSQSSNILGL